MVHIYANQNVNLEVMALNQAEVQGLKLVIHPLQLLQPSLGGLDSIGHQLDVSLKSHKVLHHVYLRVSYTHLDFTVFW